MGQRIDPLGRVRLAMLTRKNAELALLDAMEEARRAGHTLAEIGDVAGVTRQAVFARLQRHNSPDQLPWYMTDRRRHASYTRRALLSAPNAQRARR